MQLAHFFFSFPVAIDFASVIRTANMPVLPVSAMKSLTNAYSLLSTTNGRRTLSPSLAQV